MPWRKTYHVCLSCHHQLANTDASLDHWEHHYCLLLLPLLLLLLLLLLHFYISYLIKLWLQSFGKCIKCLCCLIAFWRRITVRHVVRGVGPTATLAVFAHRRQRSHHTCQGTQVYTHQTRHPFNSLFTTTTSGKAAPEIYTILHLNEARDDVVALASADHMQIMCTSLQTGNHASTSSLSFLQAGRFSWCPINSVKRLKAKALKVNRSTHPSQLHCTSDSRMRRWISRSQWLHYFNLQNFYTVS